MAFYTVGHSTHSFDEFLQLLRTADITGVCDVRRLPGSNAHPQFNQDRLAEALAVNGIDYRRIEALTGRRGRSKDVDPLVNANWRNQSFHNYADYALSPQFREGLAELEEFGHGRNVAIMCAESLWWRCHRRIIADHLLARGYPVFTLMPGGKIEPAKMTDGASQHDDGRLTYPAKR